MSAKRKNNSFMEKLAKWIVEKRSLIFLLYVAALVFSVIGVGWVQIENDVTVYLPEGTETRLGVEAMNENFAAFGTARVMVSNVTYETAEELSRQVAEVEGILMVTFDHTEAHYKDASALLDVNFIDGAYDERAITALENVRQVLSGYDVHIDTTVGQDQNAMLMEEMSVILIVGVVIMLTVLTLTSRSYMEIPVLVLTFGAAVLMNLGTNFIYGKISFISNSVAAVLQLIVSQRLVRKLCDCAVPDTPSPELVDYLRRAGLPTDGFRKPVGCKKCGGTGYLGRQALFDIMVMDNRLREVFEDEHATISTVKIEIEARHGSSIMAYEGYKLAAQGVTSVEEVERVTFDMEHVF